MRWSGLVLAGGESRRMGRDKALLRLGDQTLLRRAVGLVRASGGEPIVIGRRRPEAEVDGARQIDEGREGGGAPAGPLVALRWGLALCGAPRVLALACDLPFMTADLIRHLLGRSAGCDAVVPRSGGVLHVLAAIYDAGCLPVIDRRLAAGERALHGLLDALRVTIVEENELERFGGSRLFTNVNTPADLARATTILAREER